jgi:hypothetical protein
VSAVIFVALSGQPRSGRQASVPQSLVLTKCYVCGLRFLTRNVEVMEELRWLFLLTKARPRGLQKWQLTHLNWSWLDPWVAGSFSCICFQNLRLPKGLGNSSSIASAVILVELFGQLRSGRHASIPQYLTKCYFLHLRFPTRNVEVMEGLRWLFLLTKARPRGLQKWQLTQLNWSWQCPLVQGSFSCIFFHK